jgi:hypothetical protein
MALIGYTRVSTTDQNPHLQVDALATAGCQRIFEETASGSLRDRIQLRAAIDFLRPGDTLVVWKLASVKLAIDMPVSSRSRSKKLSSHGGKIEHAFNPPPHTVCCLSFIVPDRFDHLEH